jgi:hypothetical protein
VRHFSDENDFADHKRIEQRIAFTTLRLQFTGSSANWRRQRRGIALPDIYLVEASTLNPYDP